MKHPIQAPIVIICCILCRNCKRKQSICRMHHNAIIISQFCYTQPIYLPNNHIARLYIILALCNNDLPCCWKINQQHFHFPDPPEIEPFSFPGSLQEGRRAQVSCSVTSGDMPVYFSWYKDNAPIPATLQVNPTIIYYIDHLILCISSVHCSHGGKVICKFFYICT